MKAGIASGAASLTAITDVDWDRMMHVNTTSCFLAVKYAAPAMMKVRNESIYMGWYFAERFIEGGFEWEYHPNRVGSRTEVWSRTGSL